MKEKEGKKSDLSRLMEYAGRHRYFTYASWVLSAISAILALVPFVYIWAIIRDIITVAPNYSEAKNIGHFGIMAVVFALLSMIIYVGGLMCSHMAAFRVASNMRTAAMHHIVKLPLGFMDDFGSGRMRKIINDSSAATETYLAHQLPDKTAAVVTPICLCIMLFVFDCRYDFFDNRCHNARVYSKFDVLYNHNADYNAYPYKNDVYERERDDCA